MRKSFLAVAAALSLVVTANSTFLVNAATCNISKSCGSNGYVISGGSGNCSQDIQDVLSNYNINMKNGSCSTSSNAGGSKSNCGQSITGVQGATAGNSCTNSSYSINDILKNYSGTKNSCTNVQGAQNSTKNSCSNSQGSKNTTVEVPTTAAPKAQSNSSCKNGICNSIQGYCNTNQKNCNQGVCNQGICNQNQKSCTNGNCNQNETICIGGSCNQNETVCVGGNCETTTSGTEVTTKKAEETTTAAVENNEAKSYAEQIVDLVNQERAKAGLGAVTLDKNIEAAALIRAKECEVSFSHTRPNGSSFSSVLTENGISYRGAGENIAWGQQSPQEVMNAWMNSSGHRANILNANFKKIGVGYYQSASGRKYWSQLFTY